MHEVSSLLARLNVATRHWHARVDEAWLDLLRPNVSRADYLEQLVRAYGFIAPFEGAYKYTPGVGRVLDFRQLMQAGLIAQDLLALGLRPAQVAMLPQCPSITPFRDIAEALGWLYLVERSTLLHDRVRQHVLERLPELSDACSYLSQYDGRVSEHWRTFGRMLDRVGAKPGVANEVVAAAQAAFATAHHWFRNVRPEVRRVG